MERKVVIFRLGNELYGLGIESVERILNETPVTPLPRTPKMLKGVFELRGETLPVLDLRTRFELPESNESHSFVVTLTPSGRIALRVDRVEGIVALGEADIEAQPEAWTDPNDPFIENIAKTGQGLVALLNPQFIVPSSVQKKVAKLERTAA